jgi:hypothetical protein
MHFVVTGTEGASVETLKWLLHGSQFSVRAKPLPPQGVGVETGGGAARPGPAHQARELLSRVAMLAQCLQLPDVTEAEWRQWPADIADANRRLDELYAGGLSRDFLGEPMRSHRSPRGGAA